MVLDIRRTEIERPQAVWLPSLTSPMRVNKAENEIFGAFLTSKLYLEKNPTVVYMANTYFSDLLLGVRVQMSVKSEQ